MLLTIKIANVKSLIWTQIWNKMYEQTGQMGRVILGYFNKQYTAGACGYIWAMENILESRGKSYEWLFSGFLKKRYGISFYIFLNTGIKKIINFATTIGSI